MTQVEGRKVCVDKLEPENGSPSSLLRAQPSTTKRASTQDDAKRRYCSKNSTPTQATTHYLRQTLVGRPVRHVEQLENVLLGLDALDEDPFRLLGASFPTQDVLVQSALVQTEAHLASLETHRAVEILSSERGQWEGRGRLRRKRWRRRTSFPCTITLDEYTERDGERNERAHGEVDQRRGHLSPVDGSQDQHGRTRDETLARCTNQGTPATRNRVSKKREQARLLASGTHRGCRCGASFPVAERRDRSPWHPTRSSLPLAPRECVEPSALL